MMHTSFIFADEFGESKICMELILGYNLGRKRNEV